tara:strand:+ start:229 stop:639 length:411 start_codon:yes stop_codon:yes gene_type:complete
MSNKDLNFGKINESKVISYLNKFTLNKYKKSNYSFCYYDFENSKYICELKSRRNNYKQYPTTMVSKSKIDKSIKNKKIIKFYFLFTDGLYSYKYNQNDELEFNRGGRNDRNKLEYNDYCFIPIELLKFITDTIKSI